MDVMEASSRAMSFTSLLHRAHWFENPGDITGGDIRRVPWPFHNSVGFGCARARLTFIVRGLVCGFWCGAAALRVLAAAGRLAAGLPSFPIHLRLGQGKKAP